jgi:hypothetical protein
MRTRLVATLVVLVLTVAVAPARGFSAEVPAAVGSSRDSGILWVEARVSDADAGRIAVRILAPRARGRGRELWQGCTFGSSTPGTYLCGIDVSRGSLAKKRSNRTARRWIARVVLDDRVVAGYRFRP